MLTELSIVIKAGENMLTKCAIFTVECILLFTFKINYRLFLKQIL